RGGEVDEPVFVLKQFPPRRDGCGIASRYRQIVETVPPQLRHAVIDRGRGFETSGTQGANAVMRRKIKGMKLDVAPDAQDILVARDEWRMAVEPIVLEFGQR